MTIYIPIPKEKQKKRGPIPTIINENLIKEMIKMKESGSTYRSISNQTNLKYHLVRKILKPIPSPQPSQ